MMKIKFLLHIFGTSYEPAIQKTTQEPTNPEIFLKLLEIGDKKNIGTSWTVQF